MNPLAFALRVLFGTSRKPTTTASPGGRGMGRRIVLFAVAAAILGGVGYAAFSYLTRAPELKQVEAPPPPKLNGALPTAEEFEQLAKTDPVAMLEVCLIRYEREGIKVFSATLEKQERVKGTLNDREVVRIMSAGEVPEKDGSTPNLRVRMIWESGFRKDPLGTDLVAALYVKGEHGDQMVTYRPSSFLKQVSVSPRSQLSRDASRYCITDGGIYRGMLRTYDAWKKRKASGELHAQYLGIQNPPQLGGRACYVIQRHSENPEVDAFAMDEVADPKADARRDGSAEVTAYIDVEKWLDIGTVLKRADGSLLGEYWFRDVKLSKEPIEPDPFTIEAIKASLKK
jgi:hypothetical protein